MFADFSDDSLRYNALLGILGAVTVRKGWQELPTKPDTVVLRKPSVEEIKRIFKSCHKLIWKAEKMSPQPAFMEFAKVMFVKLWEDRGIHGDPVLGALVKQGLPIPRDRLRFSKHTT